MTIIIIIGANQTVSSYCSVCSRKLKYKRFLLDIFWNANENVRLNPENQILNLSGASSVISRSITGFTSDRRWPINTAVSDRKLSLLAAQF